MHKVINVLDVLPESVQPFAEEILAKICYAEHLDHATEAAKYFGAEFCPNRPTAAGNIRDDNALRAFCDFHT